MPLFKSFILTFEQKEQLIHRLHRSLVENFRIFFGCFIKSEVINTPYNKLNLIDVASNFRKLKILYVGDENEKLVSSLWQNKIQSEIATDFYRKLHTAYVTAAVCIQKKYALNNPLLRSFCALDPRLCQWVILNYATSHNDLQRATTNHNHPQRATTSHNDLQQPPRKLPSITLWTLYVLFIIK